MAVAFTLDNAGKPTGVVITDGVDSRGNAVTGTENLLLQLALDRAAANTGRVAILQEQLREQNDQIAGLNSAMSKLLGATVADPNANGASLAGVSLSAAEQAALAAVKGVDGTTSLSALVASAGPPLRFAANTSFNDFLTNLKAGINQATNQNQTAVINYQSAVNQRNQMTEWVANLITVLATAASQIASSLR